MSGSNPAHEPSREVLGKSSTTLLVPLRKWLMRTVFLGLPGPLVKTLPPSTGGAGFILGWGSGLPHSQKSQNRKQK